MTTDWTGERICPLPIQDGDQVLLAHGEGGRLARRLIRERFLRAFDNEILRELTDAAILPELDGRLAMTTDCHVVTPLFFPGGDIGKLAVYGTVNDLVAAGAIPRYLSVAFILEEGLPIATLENVVQSMRDSADVCGVQIVAGDTKVVPRGAADGLFIQTTGLGQMRPGIELGANRVRPGDRVLVSGTIGDHGISILAARAEIDLESNLLSDTAPLHGLVNALIDADVEFLFLRDPTRGGVSSVLHELSEASGHSIVIEEASLPLADPVRAACEILGLDPLYIANEGKMVLVVGPTNVDAALAALHSHPLGRNAAAIGEVVADSMPQVSIRGILGVLRSLDEPTGAPLPRIC